MQRKEKRWQVGGENVAYGHSTGRLRMLETHLLTQQDLEASVKQGKQLLWDQLLDQLNYPEAETNLERIAAARQEADDLLRCLSADRVLAYSLLLYQCYHNLKVFLKILLPQQNQNEDPLHLDSGLPTSIQDLLFWGSPESPQDLWKLVLRVLRHEHFTESFEEEPKAWTAEQIGLTGLLEETSIRVELPPIYAFAILQAEKAYIQSQEVGRIDAVLDRIYYGHLFALAQGSRVGFLKTYAGLKADLANLNALSRVRRLGLQEEEMKLYWVPGGQLQNEEAFEKILQGDRQSWHSAFQETPVEELVDLAFNLSQGNALEDSAAGLLGHRSDNLLMDLAREGLHVIYGPQVVAGYWLARQTEAQNLRLLLSLQAQNQSPEMMMKLLREVYIHG